MSSLISQPLLVLFSGLPGTLKTYISSRFAQRLGCLWLPTFAFGNIKDPENKNSLQISRSTRYSHCIEAMQTLSLMSARVVVDGGFMDAKLQRQVFVNYSACPKLLIRCEAESDTRLARLRMRASDAMDVEQASAESIISSQTAQIDQTMSGNTETPAELGCDAIVHIDTARFQWRIEGTLAAALQERIAFALERIFNEFRATDKISGHDALNRNFADLASCYEETTEWRTDATLLAQLRVDLPKRACNVLDVGSGTGLASQWYTEQGHNCVGVDLSPQMSVRAAPRVLFSSFGSALDLPFFDASFDLALMRQILHYTEPALALQEAFRVVRPGGFLVVAAAVAPGDEVKPVWEEFKNVSQPLRLRVFSEADLTRLIEQAGFAVVETRLNNLMRSESFEQLERRATAPGSGWASFLKVMEKIFAGLAPQLEFKVDENIFTYRQYWVTLVAQKPFDKQPSNTEEDTHSLDSRVQE